MTRQMRTRTDRRQPVVLAGGTQFVLDQVARACAAAGTAGLFVPTLAEALTHDPLVLLVAVDQAAAGVHGQREVIVVGTADDEQRAWGSAAALASSRVVILPQGAGWLAEHLGRRVNPAATGAVVGFVGTAGGCGVSTFAFWCARRTADQGRSVLLVDAHPLGGGLDRALGIEEHPGVRWHDLEEIRGTLGAEQLAAALPSVGGLSVLSHGTRPGPPGVGRGDATGPAGAVMEAARGAFDTSFIDLGSTGTGDRALASACDRLVLLVPSRPRGVAAAAAVLQECGSVPVTMVLRGPVLDGLDAWAVAELAGRPGPLPYLPFVRGAATAEASGRMFDFALPRKARRIVESVAAEGDAAA
ncbi:septum site-determining protein Ssd [Arthrobacter sp. TmT3-37]